MKKILYIIAIVSLLHSCAKDDSSEIFPNGNPNFSTITITSAEQALSVDLEDELVFMPVIKQKVEGKALKYIWTANTYDAANKRLGEQIKLHEGLPFKHKFDKLGEYKLRLEVQNEDYSEFKEWDLSVRAYDKGYFVAGIDDAGNSSITFGRTLSEKEILAGKKIEFVPNLIGAINSEININHFVHITKSILDNGSNDGHVYLFTRDKIYAVDENTLKVLYISDMSSIYPGEYIEKVSVIDSDNLSAAMLATSKKRFLSYRKKQFGIYQQATFVDYSFDETYVNLISTYGSNPSITTMEVDYEESKIWTYVPYGGIFNNTTGAMNEDYEYEDGVKPNEYEGYDILNVMRMNGDSKVNTQNNFYAIATKKDDPLTVKLVGFTTHYETTLTNASVERYTSQSPITYKKGAPVVPNARYNCAYYANQNKIYQWYPSNVSPNNRLPNLSAIDVGEGKEITTMTISYNMRQLYVGVYDKNSTNALKGSMYIYNTEDIGIKQNLQPVEKHENITTKPVQIYYKSNVQDLYVSDDTQLND